MRQLTIGLAVVLIGVVGVAGCGSKEPPPPEPVMTPPPPPPVQQTPPEEPPAPPPAPTKAPLVLRDINFDYDKSDIRSDARSVLDSNINQLKEHADARVVIEGHCDERGSVEYNLALGQRRAHATMQYMIRKGIGASRVSIVSYGEERPLDMGHNEMAWGRNRRAHFVVRE